MSLKVSPTFAVAGCWLLCVFMGMTTEAYGPQNHACCVKYTRTAVDFNQIIGFAEQSSREVCRIDAIIFLTKKGKKVCSSAKDEWVRNTMARLSAKMKKMSQQSFNRVNHTLALNGSARP